MMNDLKHALEKISHVLASPELTIGRNRVEAFSLGTDFEQKLKAFTISTFLADKSHGTRELIILPRHDYSFQETQFDKLHRLLEHKEPYDRIYILDNGLATIRTPGHPYEILGVDEFHDLLIQLPTQKKLNELLLDEGETRNRKQIDDLYQTRTAVLRYEPMDRDSTIARAASLDDHLHHWAHSQNPSNPILLLGERGSGKTWQLLKFCQEQNQRHLKNKWEYGPAFLIKLRTFRDFLRNANRCRPDRIPTSALFRALFLPGLCNDERTPVRRAPNPVPGWAGRNGPTGE